MLLQASMSRFFLYTLRHAIEAKLIFVPSNIYGTALLAVEIGVVAVSTLILCPLEVIVAKLATQLQQAAMVQTDSEEEENQEAEAIPQAITYAHISNAGEDVIE